MSGDLLGLIANISELDQGSTIYVRRPWSPSSETLLVSDEVNTTVPRDGFDYFLEVDIASDFLSDLSESDPQRRCERLIQYAVNDC